MTYRRLGAAAALLLFAAFLKVFLPSYTTALAPALRAAASEQQLVLRVPEAWRPWLGIG